MTRLAGGAAVVAYAVGLVVVNAFLLPYGVSDFSLFRARFILTGLLFLSVLVLATAGPLFAFYFSREWVDGLRGRHSGGWAYAWNSLFVALIFLVIPAGVYWLVLGQSWFNSLVLYFMSGVLGGLVLWAGWFRRAVSAGWRSALPSRLPHWTMYSLIGVFVVPYAFLTVTIYATDVYPAIPEQLGGANPRSETYSVRLDSVPAVTGLGIEMADADSGVTTELRTIFASDEFYVVADDEGGLFVLSAELVLARRTSGG